MSRPCRWSAFRAKPAGAARTVLLAGLHALPEEVGGLESHQAGSGCGARRLRGEEAGRFLELVVVRMRGREPVGGVDPLVVVESGHVEGGAQVLDGGGRGTEQCGAAQFVQQGGLHALARWFLEGAFEAAAGGLRGADGEVLLGRFAELFDQFLVVVRVDFEQVPGGRGGAEPGPGDRPGGPAVHRGAGGRRDGPVDGARDERVDELKWVEAGDDTGLAQSCGAVGGFGRAHSGQGGGEVLGDVRAEDGGGPGEPVGVGAEPFEPGD